MSQYVGAGRLDKPAQVLECRETGDGVWEWVEVRSIWAHIDLQQKTNLFSSVGVGARDASLVVWRQELTLHNAIRQGGTHFFLTSITERNRNQLDVRAALCAVAECRKDADLAVPGCRFPGILTEKYVGHTAPDLHAEVITDYVLVTPKAITLDPGSWVTASGRYYRVLEPHELDPYKNEYVIRRKEDC